MKMGPAQIKEAVDRFKALIVKHSHLQAAMDEVMFLLDLSPNVAIVNLVGPTGIGKTLLLERLVEAINGSCRAELESDPDFVPVIRTNAIASGYRLFDWKGLYRDALAAGGDPFAGMRKAPAKGSGAASPFAYAGESGTAAELRSRLEKEFRLRRTRTWIIDEAQHALFGGKGGRPGDQFDVMKSLAQNSGVKIVLAGPYEMEPALGSSGQLARRSATVHFRRYRESDAHHMKSFAGVARTLFTHMGIEGHPALDKEVLALLYTGSAGCIGVLKDWFARALGSLLRELEEGQPAVLTLDHLRQTRLAPRAMETIMADIHSGEEAALGGVSDADYARIVLSAPSSVRPAHTPPSKPRGRVGTRSPRRDPVSTSSDCAAQIAGANQ